MQEIPQTISEFKQACKNLPVGDIHDLLQEIPEGLRDELEEVTFCS